MGIYFLTTIFVHAGGGKLLHRVLTKWDDHLVGAGLGGLFKPDSLAADWLVVEGSDGDRHQTWPSIVLQSA